MPPHKFAAGVRAKNRQKKERFLHPFGFCRERTDPREVAQTANLFAMSSVQFGRSVVACNAAAQLCGRGTSPNGHKKKNVFTSIWLFWWKNGPREVAQMTNLFVSSSVQFGRSVEAQSAAAQLCGRGTSLQNRHKKKNVFTFFLAPVEGLGPPTLRLTAECSTD